MENLKNEFLVELLHNGFDQGQAVRALSCLAVALHGYNVTPRGANLVPYDKQEATAKLIKLYADCKRIEGCSAGFCSTLELMLPKLYSYAGKGVQELTSFDIRAFLAAWQQERGVSNATLDRYRVGINGFYTWLANEGYAGKNPCSSIGKIKQEQKPREALSQMELEEIRAVLQTPRERAIIEIMYSSGCRVAELVGIKLTDIRWQGMRTTVTVLGKGKKVREIPLNAKAQLAIKSYLASRGFDSEYLVASDRRPHGRLTSAAVRKIIDDIDTRVAGKISHHLHPHLFRHTTATVAVNNGMPVQEVQMLLGHSSIDTTMIYASADKAKMLADYVRTVI